MASATPNRRPTPWWLRAFLLVGSAQILVIGLSGLLAPQHITIPLHVSPLNARFIGALYLAGGAGLVTAALARAAYDARIFIFCFAAVTTAILVVTLANWSTFTADGVPWVWLVTYVVDPLLVPVVVTATGIWRPDRPRRHRWSPLFLGMAAALGSVGLLLLLWPGAAIALWPWTMTPLLARLYASFFLGYALGGLLCAWEPLPSATLAVRVSAVLLGSLVLVASALHLDRFGSTRDVVGWFAAFATLGLAFLVTLAPVPLGSAGGTVAVEPPSGAAAPPGDGR